VSLEHYSSIFIQKCRYYDKPESDITTFKNDYDEFKRSKIDQTNTVACMNTLITKYIVSMFHESSYLQEDLVNVYKELNDILDLTMKSPSKGVSGAVDVYRKLLAFKPALSASIQRGDIKHGFQRSCAWHQTVLPVSIKFILGPILGRALIGGKTLAVLKGVESLRSAEPSVTKTLSRPIRDMTELYHATKESEVSSMMILSAYITFSFSLFISIVRVIDISGPRGLDSTSDLTWVRTLLTVAQWASLGTLLGAFIAVFHFYRKLKHLFGLDSTLARRRLDPRLRTVISVTRTQEFITMIRFLSVVGSSAALALFIAGSTGDIGINPQTVSYIAMGGVGFAILSAFLFIVFEFSIRYNLEPRLGQIVSIDFARWRSFYHSMISYLRYYSLMINSCVHPSKKRSIALKNRLLDLDALYSLKQRKLLKKIHGSTLHVSLSTNTVLIPSLLRIDSARSYNISNPGIKKSNE
jgi:hypothetical protein